MTGRPTAIIHTVTTTLTRVVGRTVAEEVGVPVALRDVCRTVVGILAVSPEASWNQALG